MKLLRSIEFRLTAWYAVALFAGFVVLGAALWIAVGYSVQDAIDERLSQQLETLITVVEEEVDDEDPDDIEDEVEEELTEYLLAIPEGAFSQIRSSNGRQVFPPEGAQAPIPWKRGGADAELSTIQAANAPYRVVTREVELGGRSYLLMLASSLEVLQDLRGRMTAALLVVTPLALALCCGVGFVIARRALRPVDEIADAAAAITVSNLERRIASRDSGDALERLTKTFNGMLERLESSVARIEQFSADASHELRTPITVIRTTAELALRHGRTDEGYRTDLNDIEAEATRLGGLIDVLLMLARDGGDRQVPMADIDLTTIAADVTRGFEDAIARKGLESVVQTPDAPVVVNGNEPSLRRMLGSLIENALAHTETGRITIAVIPQSSEVLLRVRDTGEGIPAGAIEHVFDRFYRVESSRSRREGRVGLGLSIAKRIAELHGAELTVTSDSDGTEFTASIPR